MSWKVGAWTLAEPMTGLMMLLGLGCKWFVEGCCTCIRLPAGEGLRAPLGAHNVAVLENQ